MLQANDEDKINNNKVSRKIKNVEAYGKQLL